MTSHLPHTDPTVQAAAFWTLAIITLVIGLAITWIAYRGYRRNESRPMLFIAVGFALIIFPQLVLLVLGFLVPITEFVLQTTMQLANLGGLLCILYAIVMEP